MQRRDKQVTEHRGVLCNDDVDVLALVLDVFRRFFERRELRVDLRIDFGDDRLEVEEQDDAVLHLDDADDAGLVADLRCRLHVLPRNAVDARDVADKEADVVVVDFRDDDVLRFVRRLHVEAARQIDERDRLAAEREEAVDIRMCLRHGRDRCARDDFADLGNVDAVMDITDAELDNLEFIRAGLEENAFLVSRRFWLLCWCW